MNEYPFIDPLADDYGPEDWGISGYKIPKTSLKISRSAGIGIGSRKLFTEDFIKHHPNTDPTKYSMTLEKNTKKHWLKKNFAFGKAKRLNYSTYAMKRVQSMPGPGHYHKETVKQKYKLGHFSKNERGSFLDDVMALSQQVPSSHKYRPKSEFKGAFKNPIYHKPFHVKQEPKNEIGPGTYEIEEAIKKFKLKKVQTFVQTTQKRECFTQSKSRKGNFVPGSAAYLVTFNNISFRTDKNKFSAEKQKVIKKHSNVPRFTEKVMKDSIGFPGPGSYEVDVVVERK